MGFPRMLFVHRDLVVTSVKRELRARFTGTVLYLAWPLVTPVLLFLVYYFIFTKLLAVKFGELPPEQKTAMGVFMFVGVLIWTAFGDGLIRCCSVIVDNGNLIKKLVFPAEVLPLNVVLVNLITMLFGVAVYLLAVTVTPVWYTPDPLALCWIPLLLVLQALFTYGVGMILATLQVFLRDTIQMLTVAVTVWMFVTPIFWTPELIILPHLAEGKPLETSTIYPYLGVIEANPMFHLVYAWREVLMRAEPASIFSESVLAPSMGRSVAIFGVWSVVVFAIGYAFFILAQRRFADEV